jgi:hypothetical protein
MRKNKRLKILFNINAVLWALSVLMIDSKSIIPLIICAVTTIWLLLFTIANTRG